MKILLFDTETTGLPQTKIINQEMTGKWPHIVQFSFIIFDTELDQICETKDFIIKLDIEIPEESTKIHGITNEISRNKGINIENVLNVFFYYLREVDLLVCHNVSFDINMIHIELLRIINNKKYPQAHIKAYKLDLHLLTNYKNIFCTLQESIDLCNIKALDKFGREYAKFPKLSELHYKLFNTIPNNLHNSFIDILVTLRCFMELKFSRDLLRDCDQYKEVVKDINIF